MAGALHLNGSNPFTKNALSLRVTNDVQGNDLDHFQPLVGTRDTYQSPGGGDPLFPEFVQQPTHENPVEVGFISVHFNADGTVVQPVTRQVNKPTHGYETDYVELNQEQAGLVKELLQKVPIWIRTHPYYTDQVQLPANAAEPYLRSLNKYLEA
jgi:hypothetical protein